MAGQKRDEVLFPVDERPDGTKKSERFPLDAYKNPESKEQVENWLEWFSAPENRFALSGEPDNLTGREVWGIWRDLIAAARKFEVDLAPWPQAVDAAAQMDEAAA